MSASCDGLQPIMLVGIMTMTHTHNVSEAAEQAATRVIIHWFSPHFIKQLYFIFNVLTF